jgi:hypothetical protein
MPKQLQGVVKRCISQHRELQRQWRPSEAATGSLADEKSDSDGERQSDDELVKELDGLYRVSDASFDITAGGGKTYVTHFRCSWRSSSAPVNLDSSDDGDDDGGGGGAPLSDSDDDDDIGGGGERQRGGVVNRGGRRDSFAANPSGDARRELISKSSSSARAHKNRRSGAASDESSSILAASFRSSEDARSRDREEIMRRSEAAQELKISVMRLQSEEKEKMRAEERRDLAKAQELSRVADREERAADRAAQQRLCNDALLVGARLVVNFVENGENKIHCVSLVSITLARGAEDESGDE